jgi:hypothetical protein
MLWKTWAYTDKQNMDILLKKFLFRGKKEISVLPKNDNMMINVTPIQ